MSTKPVPILMYHSISEGASPGFASFTVSVKLFDAHMKGLRDHGFTPLTISALAAAWDGEAPLPQKPIVITFDDGFEDFHSAALPTLQRHAIPATIYITTQYMGCSSEWLDDLGEGQRPMMSWQQVVECHAAGIEIGAHSVTHAALDRLSRLRLRQEIANCKTIIEDNIQANVASFAYPYGYYNQQARVMVRDCGFQTACAVNYAMATPRQDRFCLSRFIVRAGTSVDDVIELASGRARSSEILYDRVRSATWRSLRRIRVEVNNENVR